MTKNMGSKILVLLSMVYGLLVALLAMMHVDGFATVAMVGAIVLAICWVALGLFGKNDNPGSGGTAS